MNEIQALGGASSFSLFLDERGRWLKSRLTRRKHQDLIWFNICALSATASSAQILSRTSSIVFNSVAFIYAGVMPRYESIQSNSG